MSVLNRRCAFARREWSAGTVGGEARARGGERGSERGGKTASQRGESRAFIFIVSQS